MYYIIQKEGSYCWRAVDNQCDFIRITGDEIVWPNSGHTDLVVGPYHRVWALFKGLVKS